MIKKNAQNLLFFFILGGLFAAGYSLQHHFAPLGGGGCNVNTVFNCDIVNRGAYAEIFGFPVAGIGLIGYLVMGIVAFMNRNDHDRTLAIALVALAIGGVLFSLYLTYIEAYVLGTWCLVCLASLSSIIGTAMTSIMVMQDKKAPKA